MPDRKHEDTTVNLDMPFDEAIRKLARAKRAGSQIDRPSGLGRLDDAQAQLLDG